MSSAPVLSPLLADSSPSPFPSPVRRVGSYVQIRQLLPSDAQRFYDITRSDEIWTYLLNGPFSSYDDFIRYFTGLCDSKPPSTVYWAISTLESDEILGLFGIMNYDINHRRFEVGSVIYSNLLQRSREATEAQYLLADYVFNELRCLRYEWKCNNLNEKSRSSALRLGFQFEGIFRSHMIIKGGRSRDTAWLAMINAEWPQRKKEFQLWLNQENFDENGKQRKDLKLIRNELKEQEERKEMQ